MKSLIRIEARRLTWDFSQISASYWFDGCPVKSALLNAYTLLVPDNEKYYVRTLKVALEDISDSTLRASVFEFMRQESLHGIAHQQFWKELKKRNINIMRFVDGSGFLLYRVMEKLQPQWLKLSIVAAVEHINASLANYFLSRKSLSTAEPEVQRLFEWHFAEEIEHKHVAHDVLKKLFPGYGIRVMGALVAYPAFYFLLFFAAVYLLILQKDIVKPSTASKLWKFLVEEKFIIDSVSHFITYAKPSFSPDLLDDGDLAAAVISQYAPTTKEYAVLKNERAQKAV